MAMILNWIAVVLPIGDTMDSHDRLIKTCIKKNLKKKKRTQINYKMVQDLYDKYKEQTDLRIGVGIGYLVFLLIPIWLEWQDDDQDTYETYCIWYWKTAFCWSIPVLFLARGFEFYVSRSLYKFKVLLYNVWQDEIEEKSDDEAE